MDRRDRSAVNPRFRGIGMTSRRTRERLVRRLAAEGIERPEVLQAIREVPRHIFVDEALASRAYEDTALPIGAGQTISQPYVVARMIEAVLGDQPLGRVLEIGTGCGYQSAVLARVAQRVYSVERLSELLFRAREHLHALRVGNVRTRHGDGFEGWPEHAPYDAIVVSAAPLAMPWVVCEQLGPRGKMVIPIGAPGAQRLVRVTRNDDGFDEQVIELVSFVPMLGGAI